MKVCRYRLLISGNVYRLGFRHFALDYARLCGVTGFAAYTGNIVYIEVEGMPAQLQSFVEWCNKGPQGSIITKFELSEMEPINSKSFTVCHKAAPVLQEI